MDAIFGRLPASLLVDPDACVQARLWVTRNAPSAVNSTYCGLQLTYTRYREGLSRANAFPYFVQQCIPNNNAVEGRVSINAPRLPERSVPRTEASYSSAICQGRRHHRYCPIKSSHDLIDRPNLYEMFGMLSTEAFGLTVNLDSDTVTVVRHGTSRYYRMIRFLVVKEEEGRCFAWRGIFNSDRKDQPTLNPVQL